MDVQCWLYPYVIVIIIGHQLIDNCLSILDHGVCDVHGIPMVSFNMP